MSAKPRKKPEYWGLYADICIRTWHTSIPDPDDEWDRADTDGEFESVRVYAYSTPSDQGIRFPVVIGDTIYVLIEEYSDGNTFGHDAYNCSDRGFYSTLEEAQEAQNSMKITDGYFDTHLGWRIEEATIERRTK